MVRADQFLPMIVGSSLCSKLIKSTLPTSFRTLKLRQKPSIWQLRNAWMARVEAMLVEDQEWQAR